MDVFLGNDPSPRMFDQGSRPEIFEVGIGVGEMCDTRLLDRRVVDGEKGFANDVVGIDLAGAKLCVFSVFVDLDLSFSSGDNGLVGSTYVLVSRRLHVDDSEVRSTRRGPHSQDPGLNFDCVTDVDRCSKTHVDVFEVCPGVFGDVLDGLTEGDEHHQARGANEVPKTHGPGVAGRLLTKGLSSCRIR